MGGEKKWVSGDAFLREPPEGVTPVQASREWHDVRIPDTWKTTAHQRVNSPPVSVDRERQTHLSLSSMELNTGVGASTDPYYPGDNLAAPDGFHGIFPGKQTWKGAWSANENVMQSTEAPVGINPLVNNNIANTNPFDTEMSDQSIPSRHNSTGLTPQSTSSAYQSSSNTSYSPPQMQEDDAFASIAAATSAPRESVLTSANLPDTLKVPAGWDTAGSPQGMAMTPGAWEQVMQDLNWDGTGLTPKSM